MLLSALGITALKSAAWLRVCDMNFAYYLSEQIKKHPAIRPQDAVKLCYQAAFGAEHLLSDYEAAKRYLYAEFERTVACDGELYERISEDICRVNLAVWKVRGFSAEKLFALFVASAKVREDGETAMKSYLADVEKKVKDGAFGFSFDDWQSFLKKYTDDGMPALHHSDAYRDNEKPAYRIVKTELVQEY